MSRVDRMGARCTPSGLIEVLFIYSHVMIAARLTVRDMNEYLLASLEIPYREPLYNIVLPKNSVLIPCTST